MVYKELYITKLVKWRHLECYICNMYLNGKIIISPKGKGIANYYTIDYRDLNEIIDKV